MPTNWKDIATIFRWSLDGQSDVSHLVCHNQVIFSLFLFFYISDMKYVYTSKSLKLLLITTGIFLEGPSNRREIFSLQFGTSNKLCLVHLLQSSVNFRLSEVRILKISLFFIEPISGEKNPLHNLSVISYSNITGSDLEVRYRIISIRRTVRLIQQVFQQYSGE